jgi:ABC-type nitrate/sulfonate/bicarbonate transport system substrate-binding protein
VQTRRHQPVIAAVLVVLGAFAVAGPTAVATDLPPVRIGWQVPWATQGQIVQSLKRTNVLELNGLRAAFKGFSYGGPLNEAALGGEVDVIFTADQPAAILLSRGAAWKIVARMMYNRVALYVPPDSAIKSVAELRGKTVAMPFGAAAQREALRAMTTSGLDPARDLRVINLDIYEQSGIVRGGTRTSWGQIDAMAGFDPVPAMFEEEGRARMLHVGQVVSLLLVSEDLARRRPADVRAFLRSFLGAYWYYATNRDLADRWFQDESRLTFAPGVLARAAAVEPNTRVTRPDQLDVWLTEDHLARIQEGADFIFRQRLTTVQVSMRRHVDLTFLRQALDDVKARPEVFQRIQASPGK